MKTFILVASWGSYVMFSASEASIRKEGGFHFSMGVLALKFVLSEALFTRRLHSKPSLHPHYVR